MFVIAKKAIVATVGASKVH